MDPKAFAILLAVIALVAALQVARVISGGEASVKRRIFPTSTSRSNLNNNSGLGFHDRATRQYIRG